MSEFELNRSDITLEGPDDFISGLLAVLYAGRISLSPGDVHSLPQRPGSWHLLSAQSGAVNVTVGGESRVLSGAAAAAVSGEEAVTLIARAGCTLEVITLLGPSADHVLEECRKWGGLSFPRGGRFLSGLLSSLHAEEEQQGTVSAISASELANHTLLQLYRSGSGEDSVKPLPQVVEAALGIIHEEFAFLSGIGELADRLEVSQEYLTRVFRSHTGMTPGSYLTRIRVERARLLLQSGMSVNLVAEACGFSSSNYFAKVFRNLTGISPTEFRRNSQEEVPIPETLPDSYYVL